MRETDTRELKFDDILSLDSFHLAQALGCGKPMAIRIGMEARARVEVGKRVLWNVKKVQEYLDKKAEEYNYEQG